MGRSPYCPGWLAVACARPAFAKLVAGRGSQSAYGSISMGARDESLPGSLRPVFWVGSSLSDLRGMEEQVREEFGHTLTLIQQGLWPRGVKPLSGFKNVWEIRVQHASDTYRLVYALKLSAAIYVLHVFKKKSTAGLSTPRHEIAVIRTRLKIVKGAQQ